MGERSTEQTRDRLREVFDHQWLYSLLYDLVLTCGRPPKASHEITTTPDIPLTEGWDIAVFIDSTRSHNPLRMSTGEPIINPVIIGIYPDEKKAEAMDPSNINPPVYIRVGENGAVWEQDIFHASGDLDRTELAALYEEMAFNIAPAIRAAFYESD